MNELYFFDAHIWTTHQELSLMIEHSEDLLNDNRLSASVRAVLAFEILPTARKMRDRCETALLENARKITY